MGCISFWIPSTSGALLLTFPLSWERGKEEGERRCAHVNTRRHTLTCEGKRTVASVFPQVEAIFLFWHGVSYWARTSRGDKAGWPVSPGAWAPDMWDFYVDSDGALTPAPPSPSFPLPTFILASLFASCPCEPLHGQSNLGGMGWYPLTAHSPWWKEDRQELKPENQSLELKKRPRENAKEILHGSRSVPFYSEQTTGTGPCHINHLSLKLPPQHCFPGQSDETIFIGFIGAPSFQTTPFLSSTLFCPFPDTLPAVFWIFPLVSVVLMRGRYCNASRGSCYCSGVRSLWETS